MCVRLATLGSCRAAEPRLVRLKRIHGELGVQICGGNLFGIFVESLDDDSPAKSPDGLQPGDLLLEVPAACHIAIIYAWCIYNTTHLGSCYEQIILF